MNPSHASPSLHAIPVFHDARMVADSRSFSPSAGKPREVVDSWRRFGEALAYPRFEPVTRDQLARAHDRTYVDGVLDGTVANGFGNTRAEVAASLPWTSGAMLAAARAALANSAVAVAPVSGFHHACFGHGGGFCTFNGLMVAALALQAEDGVAGVGILDYDMHYGNGTDEILQRLAPGGIVHYTAGAHYHSPVQAEAFLDSIPDQVRRFAGCQVLLYQAGADPHIDDPLGGWLTDAQLARRDSLVFETCKAIGLPVAWNLAGGYQTPLRKVLDIHDATMRACIETWRVGAGSGERTANAGTDPRRVDAASETGSGSLPARAQVVH